MKRVLLLAFFYACLGQNGFAQRVIDNQFNAWYMYFGNHKVADKWSIHTEYQWRRSGIIQNWQQSLLRVGVDYHVAKNMMVTTGYGWIVSYPYGKQPIAKTTTEHRIWQQLILKQQVWRLYFNHRFRLEQRFIEDWQANEAGEQELNGFKYRNRGRYRFMISIPLSRKELVKNTLFLAIYEEVFLGFGKGIGTNILDQNRLYGALGWKFSPQLNVQLGYLNHYAIKSDGIRHERNHTIQLSCTYNIDFRKKHKAEK
ncbi:MAG: hypothetical protein ACI9UR_001106 [Bacteroidia bacterium]|jgi:hypothetical protein